MRRNRETELGREIVFGSGSHANLSGKANQLSRFFFWQMAGNGARFGVKKRRFRAKNGRFGAQNRLNLTKFNHDIWKVLLTLNGLMPKNGWEKVQKRFSLFNFSVSARF
jgi:hypothetical protein